MSIEVRQLTLGPVAENCFVVRPEGGAKAVVVDPGDEAERILALVEEMNAEVEAILITHCHFDHIGAVTPVAKATGAPVYCPEVEVPALTARDPTGPRGTIVPASAENATASAASPAVCVTRK